MLLSSLQQQDKVAHQSNPSLLFLCLLVVRKWSAVLVANYRVHQRKAYMYIISVHVCIPNLMLAKVICYIVLCTCCVITFCCQSYNVIICDCFIQRRDMAATCMYTCTSICCSTLDLFNIIITTHTCSAVYIIIYYIIAQQCQCVH